MGGRQQSHLPALTTPVTAPARRTQSDTSCHCSRAIPHVAPWQAGHTAPSLAILQESLLQMKRPQCFPGCQMLPTHCCSPQGSAPAQVGTGPAANLLWGMQPPQPRGSEGHTPLTAFPSVKSHFRHSHPHSGPFPRPLLAAVAPSPGWWMHPPQMLPATSGMSMFSRQLPGPAALPRLGGHRVPALISLEGLGKTAICCPGEPSSQQDTAAPGAQSAQGDEGTARTPFS